MASIMYLSLHNGIEPLTSRLTAGCSTYWANEALIENEDEEWSVLILNI